MLALYVSMPAFSAPLFTDNAVPPAKVNCPEAFPNASYLSDKYCFGLGEYVVGTPVTQGKCPQLNLTTQTSPGVYEATRVLSRSCFIGKKPPAVTGPQCYGVTEAVWNPASITGIGLNGYWTDFQTTIGQDLYGWIDGVIPDDPPQSVQLTEGLEVLCRSPDVTDPTTYDNTSVLGCDPAQNPQGCWMEGNLVGQSPGDTWVCKLTDLTRPLMPYTPVSNIRPLCFAKSHCDYKDPTCTTCAPHCSIGIKSSGYLCPDRVNLTQNVLTYDKSALSDKLYHKGQVTGMYFKNPQDQKMGTNLQLQIDSKPATPVWGPQPGTTSYVIPFQNATGITDTSFGRYTLCPAAGSVAGTKYAAGTIFNTPMQTTTPPGDGKYHLYTCDNEALDPSKALKCDPDEMLDLCWPEGL